MCGLTGFVAFDRDHAGELGLKPMIEALACRGPDAQASWLDDRAALGHTRLAIVDLDGGRQPMEDGAVLVFTGEISNHRALRSRLEAGGHRFRTRSGPELVLAGYRAWGEGLAERLEGVFAFAVWDPRRGRLLLGRDRLGVKPLFYRWDGRRIWFGSEPKALLAHPDVPATVDLDGLRELVLSSHPMISTPGRTPHAGIAEVLPGHVVSVTAGGCAPRRYWSLEPREHTDDLPTTVATVRSLLERAVDGHLESDVPRCTLLSGGLDSSLITALVPGAQDTVSVDLGEPRHPVTDAMRRDWDAPYVDLMAGHAGSRHRSLTIPAAELADPALREQVVAARDGLGLGDFDASALLLFRAVRERHTVALSGEGADEIFGGYRWFRTGTRPGFPWTGVIDRADLTRLLDPALTAALDLTAHRRDLYASAAAEVAHLPGADARERSLRLNSHLNLTRFLPVLLDRSDRLSMSGALEVRVPFCDHRLVEYVFNTPWAMKTFDGREKSLLRAAARGLVPQRILDRRKSPYPVVRDPAYRAALTGQVAGLLAGDGPALPLLDVEAVRRLLVDAPAAGRFPREGLELVLDLDAWLRLHRPHLDL